VPDAGCVFADVIVAPRVGKPIFPAAIVLPDIALHSTFGFSALPVCLLVWPNNMAGAPRINEMGTTKTLWIIKV
jgi:hypothetical protein